jgi:hypothetical protein
MFKRSCPQCSTEKTYVNERSFVAANKNNSVCRKCAAANSGFTNRYAVKGCNTGTKNAFYGKRHTDSTKKRMSAASKGRELHPKFKARIGNRSNLVKGSLFDYWLKKHGESIAQAKLNEFRATLSNHNSGSGNPMYGKPCPGGSGYGWKGWFKGTFFRSLRELSFLVAIQGRRWSSGESLCIPYRYRNAERTYRPDFILDGKLVVEIKPKKLHSTRLVQAKAQAATAFCAQRGMKYKLIDQQPIEFNELEKLVESGDVVWHERYEQRYTDYKGAISSSRASR